MALRAWGGHIQIAALSDQRCKDIHSEIIENSEKQEITFRKLVGGSPISFSSI